MDNNPVEPVSCKYGAPMGRRSHSTFTDKQGNTYLLNVTEDARPFYLLRIYLNNGGYDSGGAYWGLGAPLYYYEGPLSDISGYVRGSTRERAKDEVRVQYPHAKFYR